MNKILKKRKEKEPLDEYKVQDAPRKGACLMFFYKRKRLESDLKNRYFSVSKRKTTMFIETESTPNPATIKFIPHEKLGSGGRNFNFESEAAAKSAPLARRFFGIAGVTGVFIAPDFVSVTIENPESWPRMKPDILSALMDHLMSGDPAVIIRKEKSGSSSELENEVVAQIVELLETRVRPAVAADGGDIVFSRFEDGIVYVEMQGACAGCPSSTITLKNGIENMLRHYIPEVVEVRAA